MSIPKLEKKVLLTEAHANSLGFKGTVDKCMEYTMKNDVEVVFKYTVDGKVFDDVFIGTNDFSDSFLTGGQIKKYGPYCTFHTHPSRRLNFFGIQDLGQLTFEAVHEVKLGIPKSNEIITIERSDFLQVLEQFLEFTAWVQQYMNSKFTSFFSSNQKGDMIRTKEGRKFEVELTKTLRERNSKVATFEKWKVT